MIAQHDRAADTALVISGGSFLTAHWFLVADKLVHITAECVSIITGVGAICYYAPQVIRRVAAWYQGVRVKL